MVENQGDLFLEGEGDSWFRRNLASRPFEEVSALVELEIINILGEGLKNLALPIAEIGSSRGDRIYRISRAIGLNGIAVDPSAEALDQGQQLFAPKVRFLQGLASNIPIEDRSVGLVFFSFCLYLTSGLEFQNAVEEASRSLAEGGFVAIYDFDSSEDVETKYAHLEPLVSYRRPYGPLVENSGFTLMSKTPLSYTDGGNTVYWNPEPFERTALWIFTRSRF